MRNTVCPHCNFQRQPLDEGPSWQCSNCGKTYKKQQGESQSVGQHRHLIVDNSAFLAWQKRLTLWLLIALCSSTTSYYFKTLMPNATEIDPLLTQEPIQSRTDKPAYSFQYLNQLYNVKPVASYELWGLVVSLNNTSGLGDIYHDETSLDTKDLCIIWGENIQNNQFHQATFSSSAWTCNLQYPTGVSINLLQVSNNHLITSSDNIRQQISQIRTGDQIRLKGSLVDYQQTQNQHVWRESSLTREDRGNSACEVVFVHELEVIKQSNPRWHSLWQYSLMSCVAIILLKALVLIIEISPYRN